MSSKYFQNLETSTSNSPINKYFISDIMSEGLFIRAWKSPYTFCASFYPAFSLLKLLLRWEEIGRRCYQDTDQTVQDLSCLSLLKKKLHIVGIQYAPNIPLGKKLRLQHPTFTLTKCLMPCQAIYNRTNIMHLTVKQKKPENCQAENKKYIFFISLPKVKNEDHKLYR